MSILSRMANLLRGDRLNRELDEELASHVEEAIADGCDPAEARRALGSSLRHRQASRDLRLIPWVESLRADAIFGLRQLRKTPVTTVAAIFSIALAIGACTSAFRLVDALLLRPLPIAEPEHLFVVARQGQHWNGKPSTHDSLSYPLFREMSATLQGQSKLVAISYASRTDLTFGADSEMEKAHRQFVSGTMFEVLAIRPAAGRVFSGQDDVTPGAHPYAVLSHDYWTRRFGADPSAVGRTFRMGREVFEVVGVAAEGFTGTEPGTFVDVFVPMMMNAQSIENQSAFWLRGFVRRDPNEALEPLAARMNAVYRRMEQERAKGFTNFPQHLIADYPRDHLVLHPAAAGVSLLQKDYELSLGALSVVVGLVLLIACANVANLMTARAASRGREMALRVSIGAGQRRLVQLVVIESAWIAMLATAVGWLIAWWSAPLVVSLINPPAYPARLSLPVDWRLLGFGAVLALAATLLFGLLPAWRASTVRPATALKGGDDPHARRRLMHVLIGAQVAFCVVVLIVGGLFVATYDRLARVPTGYSSERLLALETVSAQPQLPAYWEQVAAHLRTVPGVETVAYSEWPLMSGEMSNDFVSLNGAPPDEVLTFFLAVSPGWFGAMTIPMIEGRDLRPGDIRPGTAVVNRTFAAQYFNGDSPVGRFFEVPQPGKPARRYEIVAMVADARYNEIRAPIVPVAYVPYQSVDDAGAARPAGRATFMVRTADVDAMSLAGVLRREVSKARPDFRVSNIRTQTEIDQAHTIRERMLAMLALFFSTTALVLACVGLFGVLDYSVLQRRREIGIRVAIGARPSRVARHVTGAVFTVVIVGMAVGLILGVASERYIRTLLFDVRATDLGMLALPVITILAVAALAALPALARALRISPATLLRSD